MSIYVVRYNNLLKIGFTEDVAKRVTQIIWGIPGGQAQFVGHMPGDKTVEQHLHYVFSDHRFSGEWFLECPSLVAWCDLMLIKDMPEEPRVFGSRKMSSATKSAEIKGVLRQYAERRWPNMTQLQRVEQLCVALGWRNSRVRDFYYGAPRAVLRADESDQVAKLVASVEGEVK